MTVDVVPQFGVGRGGNPGTTLGNSGAQGLTGVGGVTTAGATLVSLDGRNPTYCYSVTATAPVATPTAFIVMQGSATRTVRIKRMLITGAATAAGNMPVQLVRRSTAGTVGSAVLTAVTAGKRDTNDPAATAVVSTVGTANYTTLGTIVAQLGAQRMSMAALGTGTAAPVTFNQNVNGEKSICLRGTSDYLTIEFNGAAVPSGGVVDFEIVTEEDDS